MVVQCGFVATTLPPFFLVPNVRSTVFGRSYSVAVPGGGAQPRCFEVQSLFRTLVEPQSHCRDKPIGEPVVLILLILGPIYYPLRVSQAMLQAGVEF